MFDAVIATGTDGRSNGRFGLVMNKIGERGEGQATLCFAGARRYVP
jgi:hypothetical protein